MHNKKVQFVCFTKSSEADRNAKQLNAVTGNSTVFSLVTTYSKAHVGRSITQRKSSAWALSSKLSI